MIKNKFVQTLLVILFTLALVMVLDRLTNRLDVDLGPGHKWDFIYYQDIADNGIIGNDHLSSPYAYRFVTPLLARGISQILQAPINTGWKVVSYLGTLLQLLGIYALARQFQFRLRTALIVMLVTAFSLFNVKFLLFDLFRSDHLAYGLLAFAILEVRKGNLGLAMALSVVGLLAREVLIIPPLFCLYLFWREWRQNRRRWQPWGKAVLVVTAVGLTLALPRQFIPIVGTQQVLDPLNNPQFFKVVFGMPLNLLRDLNLVLNLASYFLPLWMIATPSRLRRSWEKLGDFRPLMVIYLVVILFMTMYGGTDMMRYVSFFFVPLALLVGNILEDGLHWAEWALMLAGTFLFNKIALFLPVWEFNAYLDFYGGYADRINRATAVRFAQIGGFTAIAVFVRGLVDRNGTRMKRIERI